LGRFSSFFVSKTRSVIPAFSGYMRGLFQSERVNMLRMSEVNQVDHQSMQHMLTDARVDWDGLRAQVAQDTEALLGGRDSVLLIDESAFAKKGCCSAGVERQWNGRLGKVDNCQVGVFAALCKGEIASLVDARLYLPQSWIDDAKRCNKA
jgi:SRSO17 transposase